MLLHTDIGVIKIDFFAVYNFNINKNNFIKSVTDHLKRIGIINPSETQINLFLKEYGFLKVIALS